MTDLCSGFEAKLAGAVSQLDTIISKSNTNAVIFDDLLSIVPADIAVPLSITDSLNDNISTLTSEMDEVLAYTGSCLDSVGKLMDGILNDVNSATQGIFDTINDISSDLLGLLQDLGGFSGKSNNSVLSLLKLLPSLDSLLGCLSSSSCLPVNDIQAIFDKIDGLEDILPINTTTYAIDTDLMKSQLITKMGNIPSIPSETLDNLSSISSDMMDKMESSKDILTTQSNSIKTSIESVPEVITIITPSNLF